jgi:hypothetical protein
MFTGVKKPQLIIIIVAVILMLKYCKLVLNLLTLKCLQLQIAFYKIVEQLIRILKHSVMHR